MQLSPWVLMHLSAALAAICLGPIALWARKGTLQRPRVHRAFGYAWVSMMIVAATTAIFIRDFSLPNWMGYTPVHVLVPLTAWTLYKSFRALIAGNIVSHRRSMQALYLAACVAGGLFTLLPQRFLGQLIWGQWLGWI